MNDESKTVYNEKFKINSKSMEIKPGQAEPKSANPLPLLWQSIKYLLKPSLIRNIIVAILIIIIILVGGNFIFNLSKKRIIPSQMISVKILDDKGNVVVNSDLRATLVNIYSNVVDLKSRFQVDEKNQVGNIAQFVQEEVAKQLQLKGL